MEPALERDWWAMGLRVAGIDEAGRGALAGPVVAAAVILPPLSGRNTYPFYDSKTLRAEIREALESQIQAVALAWAVGRAEAAEIDRLGILKATHLAALRALEQLTVMPEALLTDYLRLEPEWRRYLALCGTPHLSSRFRCPPKADQGSPTVAAASILAKVARDRYMQALEQCYPGYGFAQHKGYGTALHLDALRRLGPCEEHRRTFAPVAQAGLL
ncbi:MAG: ribonuclease HII [Meiothermus sp.]|uniref:ribonuclease HII n=1 Tax=Meiothermus sp. TaxID=1955249 RepID=UPI0025DAB7FC|nr:ribonuclease HII [Meiothermus sp.]MCS7068386.1 ribonuclease HII [Meiothermus sp.]MCX7601503.1 ribonuclease HII [Meiothermus sp.]MDW8424837.1 ribonuclease HII [Meiothermus sp.]